VLRPQAPLSLPPVLVHTHATHGRPAIKPPVSIKDWGLGRVRATLRSDYTRRRGEAVLKARGSRGGKHADGPCLVLDGMHLLAVIA